MRRVKIFAGTSHPGLVNAICDRLSTVPAECELKKFSNGEISVNIGTSVRDQDVYIVQSGSGCINDSIMELLIMISACKGGSAKSITAVMPYYPYSRQSKKKAHRGAITAKLLANLLSVSGIDNVITVDLHAPPTQGFFGKPVDNLHAEPIFARWIKSSIGDWKSAVVVSKNPGGTKRVTSLADALKLHFAIITTDRRRDQPVQTRCHSLEGSAFFEKFGEPQAIDVDPLITPLRKGQEKSSPQTAICCQPSSASVSSRTQSQSTNDILPTSHPRLATSTSDPSKATDLEEDVLRSDADGDASQSESMDRRAQEVITGRLIHGRIVDDDTPSPALSIRSTSAANLNLSNISGVGRSATDDELQDALMTTSFLSLASRRTTTTNGETAQYPFDDGQHASDEEEEGLKDPDLEHTVTLVGDVYNRTVLIVDDMIDQAGSWIAAAETVVKRGGASGVYCIATHGLFGESALEDMEACDSINKIVVSNTYPIAVEKVQRCSKLVILDLSSLLSEAIRKLHYGESASVLFQHDPT